MPIFALQFDGGFDRLFGNRLVAQRLMFVAAVYTVVNFIRFFFLFILFSTILALRDTYRENTAVVCHQS